MRLLDAAPAARLPYPTGSGSDFQVNSPVNDWAPSLSADGLALFFESDDRPGGGGGADIWVATRSDTSSPFDTPVNISEVNSMDDDQTPSISAGGLTLYFRSTRASGVGGKDIWMATRRCE